MTVLVRVDKLEVIREGAPIVRKFIGQPLSNLEKWLSGQGELIRKEIK